MATVDANSSSLPVGSVQVTWLGLMVTDHLALSLYSSNEPAELS